MAYDMPPALVELAVPAGFVPMKPEDVDKLYPFQSADELRFTGQVAHTKADMISEHAEAGIYQWVKWGDDGEPIAVAGIMDAPSNTNIVGWLTAPDADETFGVEICNFLLHAARAVDGKRPIHLFTYGEDTKAVSWFEVLGGTLIRRFGRMDVALDGDAPPTVSADIEIRGMTESDEDWRTAHAIIDTAFLDHFGHQASSYEAFVEREKAWVTDITLCWLCFVDGAPAAALLGKQRPTDGYVGVLGTLRDFRGRGLGRLLLRTAFAEFAKRGEKRASLNVDLTNPTGAVGLYESVGMALATTDVAYEFAVPE